MALKLVAELGLDGRGFVAGLQKAQSIVGGSFKSAIAGAFSIGAVTALTKKTIDFAGNINDLSERLGVSTDFLQEFQYVAKQTGTSLEKLTKVIEHMGAARDAALGGDTKQLAAFEALGINRSQLQTSRLEDLISGPIAAALKGADAQGRIGVAFREIGGKGSGELIAGFTEGFNEGRSRAHQAGAVMSEDIIQQLDDIGDAFANLASTLVGFLGPAIASIVNAVRFLVTGIRAAFAFIRNLRFGAGAQDQAWIAASEVFTEADRQRRAEAAARAATRAARNRSRIPEAVMPLVPAAVHRGPTPEGDALVRVGNFLGSSQSVLARIGQVTNEHLRAIRDDIRRIATRTGEDVSFLP